LSEVQVERESVGSEDWPVCVDLKSCVSIKETTGFEFWFLVLFFIFFFFFDSFLIFPNFRKMRKNAKTREKRKTKNEKSAKCGSATLVLYSRI
jgi:hypothetical protein